MSLEIVTVFLAMALVDACWTAYVVTVAERQALRAAVWNTAIIGLSAFVVRSYVNDVWLLVPALAGGFVGTYVTIWLMPRKPTS